MSTVTFGLRDRAFSMPNSDEWRNHDCVNERYADSSGAISFRSDESERPCASMSTKFRTIAENFDWVYVRIEFSIERPNSGSRILTYFGSGFSVSFRRSSRFSMNCRSNLFRLFSSSSFFSQSSGKRRSRSQGHDPLKMAFRAYGVAVGRML